MLKPAFSTVACPEWTLDRVALAAGRLGFLGVELRTFDVSSRRFACDPALTDPAKVRRLMGDAGVEVCSIATDCSFDALVLPPVIGHVITDTEVQVRRAERAIDLAAALGAPHVRVYGFRVPAVDSRTGCITRIAERLRKVADHAEKTGVKVALQNGGSFSTVPETLEVLEAVNHPLMRVSYCVASAFVAGETPASGLARIASAGQDRLALLRVKDLRDGLPVPLGTGGVPVRAAMSAAASAFARTDTWCVFEWDRAWLPDIGEPEFALEHAARTMYQWAGLSGGGSTANADSARVPSATLANA
jgi:sugar phosphate isomerase/epimerase